MQMVSFNFYGIKSEKANALMLRHRQLQKIANLCRVIEVCVVLVLISRLSMQLPLAVKNSTGYFRDVQLVMVSPRFVFFVGNLIVITLFAKSGQFSARDSTANASGIDLIYEEFIKNSESISRKVHPDETPKLEEHSFSDESAVRDYWTVESYSQDSNGGTLCEKSSREGEEKEECRESTARCCERLAKSSCPEDEMSSEEFQRKVEAFIAWHQRFRWEEDQYSI